MARYLVDRTFPDSLAIPMTAEGVQVCLTVVGNNTVDGVTWVHSYVTPEKRKPSASMTLPHRKRSARLGMEAKSQ